MIDHGIKGIVGGGAAAGIPIKPVIEAWQQALARHGRQTELGGDLIFGLSCYFADNEEQAFREACPIIQEYQKMFAPLGFVRPITPEQVELVADPKTAHQSGLPDPRQAGWTLGPPERMVERLLAIEAEYPGRRRGERRPARGNTAGQDPARAARDLRQRGDPRLPETSGRRCRAAGRLVAGHPTVEPTRVRQGAWPPESFLAARGGSVSAPHMTTPTLAESASQEKRLL